MDNIDKYIDEMFHRKLSGAGAPVPSSGVEWTQISKAIQRKNFMRFNPGSFNVYYLAATVGTIATVGTFTLPEILNNNLNNINIPEQVILVTDSISSNDTIPSIRDTVFETTPSMFAPARNNIIEKFDCSEKRGDEKPATTNTQCKEVPERSNDVSIDSLKSNSPLLPDTKETLRDALPLETDTIINVDTIRIQKKEVKLKRKRTTF
jgi:hypothetical protein